MEKKSDRSIIINLPNGLQLFAEQSADPNYKNEITLGIIKDGVWHQDLAIVRNRYIHDENNGVRWVDNQFEVLVYADENNEDYTDSFTVGIYQDDE